MYRKLRLEWFSNNNNNNNVELEGAALEHSMRETNKRLNSHDTERGSGFMFSIQKSRTWIQKARTEIGKLAVPGNGVDLWREIIGKLAA